ncbi:MAG TPA: 50S ribosomal protein L22 [Alphaproteobacteria bacterium]|nr:50S ribosomal protein L22 [Alphaproteobacteria bacterium]
MGKKATERRLKDNEAMAFSASIRTSPRKLNLVAELIRGLAAEQALAELTFSRRRIAGEVKKVLASAIANAENNHQLDVDRLYVAEASVGKALVMKRFHARARGRGVRIVKPFSNLRIVVRERSETQAGETA